MTIDELIGLSEARLSSLQSSLTLAASSGDVARMTSIESEIAQTKETINTLLAATTSHSAAA